MSDNKRSRRYNSLKEVKRVILAKKENREDSGPVEPPKLLLKPKPNTESQKQAVTQPAAISIAVREPPGNAPAKTATVIQPGTGGFPASAAGVPNARDHSDVRLEAKPAPIESNQSKYKQMTSPLPLINDHFQIDSSPLNFLSESNDSFHVVGVVGTQGTGKSTLLNLLAVDLPYSFKGWSSEHDRFATNRTSENGSCNPTTEGVNMFVTAERVILLDSSPVLCNPYKKDAVLSELDDLKIISFMLSVCHTVLVVEEEPFNTSLLRLLCCADMMRLSSLAGDKSEKLANPTANSVIHRPHVMFVHNLAKPSMFLPVFRQRLDQTYRACLKNTELRILAGNDLPDRTNARHSEQPLNTFTFPKVPKKESAITFSGHNNIPSLVQRFQHRVLMLTPRIPFPGVHPPTEMHWWQLVVTAAWESHKTNYFLRKYESDASSKSVHQ